MILLVTPSERASECATALSQATGEKITVAGSLARSTTILRAEPCVAVVLDQYLFETEPDDAAVAMEQAGTAVVVPVNLALSGLERLVREVRMSLKRRCREEAVARSAAVAKLHSELNGTVTALLLSSELALETPRLPPDAADRLRGVHDLVTKLQQQLQTSDTIREFEASVRS